MAKKVFGILNKDNPKTAVFATISFKTKLGFFFEYRSVSRFYKLEKLLDRQSFKHSQSFTNKNSEKYKKNT